MEIKDDSVANFIQKTFTILENAEFQDTIEWTANGKEFAIKDIELFEQTILPRFFRHSNINSFIRQLNMYGFHKSRKEPTKNIFSHPHFLKGKAHLLPLIRRKIKGEDKPEDKHPEAGQDLTSSDLRQEQVPEAKQRVLEKTAVKPKPEEDESYQYSTQALIQPSFFELIDFEVPNRSHIRGMFSRSIILDYGSNRDLNKVDIFESVTNFNAEKVSWESSVFCVAKKGISLLNSLTSLSEF